ncbi:rhodanese-like domain-containing protein [Sphingorhabdus sp.]|jgi:phage shock protein E|uniref:rhodanese-like domain-containing protein n=1 Tax=Sphingorhabdus sp. TaxID=1902408 RepID=UPI003BAE5DEA|nr:rhodanese-like domain-containing protein [Sphingomonadales bacterium]MBK9432530.1 rhodanese-like domain-containing protein [Sphingomonadales bacterium]MBL0021935.1 rhodanese-like domain-containing protein [Sphingomonadales bacterium]
MRITLITLAFALASPALAQSSGSPLIDYQGFSDLTAEVRPYRANRLVSLAEFQKRAAKGETLLLDARSAQAFKEGHLEGAVNLPLPDFTAEALADIIGKNANREILIYCNNNFINNRRPVVTKALPLALNIQTFINLYGYGYKNVWELGDAVDMDDPKVRWISSTNS